MGRTIMQIPQKIGGKKVFTAHRDFADFCQSCGGDITKEDWYIRAKDGLHHYFCYKKLLENDSKKSQSKAP